MQEIPSEADDETEPLALEQSARIETEIVWATAEAFGPPTAAGSDPSERCAADADCTQRGLPQETDAAGLSQTDAHGAARSDDCVHSQALSASTLRPCVFGEASLLAALDF